MEIGFTKRNWEKNWALEANYASGKPTEDAGKQTRRRLANFNPVNCLHTNSGHEVVLDCGVSVLSRLFASVEFLEEEKAHLVSRVWGWLTLLLGCVVGQCIMVGDKSCLHQSSQKQRGTAGNSLSRIYPLVAHSQWPFLPTKCPLFTVPPPPKRWLLWLVKEFIRPKTSWSNCPWKHLPDTPRAVLYKSPRCLKSQSRSQWW